MLIKPLLLNAFKLVGIPIIVINRGVPKRSNGAGCKPVDFGLRKFRIFPPPPNLKTLIIKSEMSLDFAGVVQW